MVSMTNRDQELKQNYLQFCLIILGDGVVVVILVQSSASLLMHSSKYLSDRTR